MGSRIRENPSHVFECFFEVVISSENETSPWIIQKFPDEYDNKEVLKSVPGFCCPCPFYSSTIQHFSFVLTNLDSNWTFGYCRYSPGSPTLLVILSCLPWHETFYKILNQVSDITNSKETSVLVKFLESLYNSPVPDPGLNLHVSYCKKEFIVYCPDHLKLPSIPENRNLTEYFNAIDAYNMMVIFASMLHERRILVVSKRLSRLSSCVQAANSLIYPMHWQHIFIPVLPKHLIDYLSAPMPYLIGVPQATMEKFRQSELNEVVILDADNNRVRTPFSDLETLPPDIVSSMKRSLKNPSLMLGDGISRVFMRALVKLIGGYRDSLKFNLGQKISFDADAFIQTRPASVQPFLEQMLHLQIFQQFIENRLDMLNSGVGFSDEFEYEVNSYEVNSNNNLKTQYKEWVNTMKKEGGAFLKNVKSKTNPAVKHAYKSVKDKGKRAYKDIRSKIQDIQKNSGPTDLSFDRKYQKPRSAPSSPSSTRPKRISYNDTKSGVMDSIPALPNSRSVTGIRRYKMLTVDEMSEESSPVHRSSSPPLQKIDLDLMSDLREVIFWRCSVSSDNLNSLDRLEEDIIGTTGAIGFSDSFCATSNLPTPIPPPRLRRTNAVPANHSTPPVEKRANDSLIQLESLDGISQFDPLKVDNSDEKEDDLLTFVAPADDFRVAELKNTINQINSRPPCIQQVGFHRGTSYTLPASGFQSMRVVQPNNGLRLDGVDPHPPLPPKTRHSTFFVPNTNSPPSRLSDIDHNLLSDYGLANAPLFQQSPPPQQQRHPVAPLRQKNAQQPQNPSWQKFT